MENIRTTIILEKTSMCFKKELIKTIKAIDLLRKTQTYFYSENGYDKQYLLALISRIGLDSKQKEERRLIADFCNEAYRFQLFKKLALTKYKEICDSLVQKLNTKITFEKELMIDACLRVAYASVGLSFPEELKMRYQKGVNVNEIRDQKY